MNAIPMESPQSNSIAPLYAPLPVIGAILEAQKNPLEMFTRAARLGELVEVKFPYYRTFLLTSPPDVEHVLHDNYKNYAKQSRGYTALRRILGNGLLTSEGSFWLRQRRLAQPAFHKEHMAGWAKVMTRAATEQVAAWAPHIAKGEKFDLHVDMMRLTLRVVGETLLSTDVTKAAAEVGDALEVALHLMAARTTRLVPVPDWVPIPSHLKLEKARAALNGVVDRIIAERRRTGPGDDLLGMFMTTKDADTGEQMDDEQLRVEVLTMLLAGHETTANALSWAFYLLGQSPDIERKLRDEIATVLQGREPSMADLPRLKYTSAVLNEALRLYPPVWALARRAEEDDVLSGVRIPQGSLVFVLPWLVHRNPNVWPNPEKFDPERWLGEQKPRSRCAFLPFSSGPRKCIGDGFALLEGQLVLATLMQRVNLSLVPGQHIEPEPTFTIRPTGGVWVTAKSADGTMHA